jgi:hypothetical protein
MLHSQDFLDPTKSFLLGIVQITSCGRNPVHKFEGKFALVRVRQKLWQCVDRSFFIEKQDDELPPDCCPALSASLLRPVLGFS